ncbi:MAG: ADP-ribose pyrophosphatase-like protein [Pseudonocardiales bacterium]|nr:ADP-ribose pyrophosphatase-like protein [Pseudonocardiales bacterium]
MTLRQPCAGAIVFDDQRRLLLIKRGRPPSQGSWSVPGGRCRPGEAERDACAREVVEETGLVVRVLHLAGRVERTGPAGEVFDIADFVCEVLGGSLRAGDDADEARWATRDELASLELVPGLLDALSGWGLLPRVG